VWSLRYVSRQTDRQAYRHAHRKTSHPCRMQASNKVNGTKSVTQKCNAFPCLDSKSMFVCITFSSLDLLLHVTPNNATLCTDTRESLLSYFVAATNSSRNLSKMADCTNSRLVHKHTSPWFRKLDLYTITGIQAFIYITL